MCTCTVHIHVYIYPYSFILCNISSFLRGRDYLRSHICTILYMFVYSSYSTTCTVYLEPLIWSNQIYPIAFVTYLLISLRLR